MEEKLKNLPYLTLALAIALAITFTPVNGQSNSICTGAMMRSFSSCIGFLSGGSNASSPTSACCDSLRSLMRNGQDCLCLIVTGGVPFQVPINRTLAISLPRACRMSGVPVECRATASPVPAPDPGSPGLGSGPSMSPSPGLLAPPPQGSFIPQPSPPSFTPGGGRTPPSFTPGGGMTPPQTPDGNIIPTLTPPGMRPTLTPSTAQPSHSALPPLMVAILGAIILCY